MKTRGTFFFLLAALTLAACKYDDSELWEQVNQNTEELAAQAARIAALEAWQAETNTNIEALQTLLSTTDYITAVTPVVKDGVKVGFTISFLNTPAITIYHGTKGDKGDKGDTPQVSVVQGDDGNWYWTLNGELLTDADGNHIQANGTQGPQGEQGEQGPQGEQGEQGPQGNDAPLPQLATGTKLIAQGINIDSHGDGIVTYAIYLSVDDGATWIRVSGEDGEKGEQGDDGPKGDDGDSFFESIDTSNADYILFTLADGNTFQVPRYTGISLTFSPESLSLLYGRTATIQCTAEGSADFTTDNLFVLAPACWEAEIALTRSVSTGFTLTVTAPDTDSEGEILVMLDNKKGSTTIERIPVKTAGGIVGTELKADGLTYGQIASLINGRTDLTAVILTNCVLSSSDWYAIRNNKSLETIDLGEATYNSYSFSYNNTYANNTTLQLLTVPDGVATISSNAFYKCKELTTVTIPASVEKIQSDSFKYCEKMTSFTIPADSKLTTIGVEAFACCYKLESIFIPATVKTIGKMGFNICRSLKSVTFAEGSQLTEIPYFCFASNKALTAIEIPPLVTTLGESVFEGCAMLANITFPAEVTSIGKRAFSGCFSLATVTCLATTPPTLGETVFYGCDALTEIRVPAGSVDAYKAAWSEYADKIKAIP